MKLFIKHSLFITGFTMLVAQVGWAQSNPSSPSSSHKHEQKCMNVKDRRKTGPCPLKDPSNKTIPGVAKHSPPQAEDPARKSATKPDGSPD